MTSLLLQNYTALVTGASKGVGKGIAIELAHAGCKIAVNFNSDAAGAAHTVAEIEAFGGEALAVKADVGSSSQVNTMFERVLDCFGRLNILVNNAGVQTWAPLLELREE